MKKKIAFITVILILSLMLCACDTTFFDSDPMMGSHFDLNWVKYEDRYEANESFIYHRDTHETYEWKFDDSADREGTRYVQEIEFTPRGVRFFTYVCLYFYDVNTGRVSHCMYYPVTYLFDFYGNQLERVRDEDGALTEDEMRAVGFGSHWRADSWMTSGLENLQNYTVNNSVYEDRYNTEVAKLTDTESKIIDYVYAAEGVTTDQLGFYCFEIDARWWDADTVLFAYSYCNKKDFQGQGPIENGYRRACLVRYDVKNGTFTQLADAGEKSKILGFTDSGFIYYKKGALMYRSLVSGGFRMLEDAPADCWARVTSDRLFLYVADVEHYTTRLASIYDLEGNLLWQAS